MVDRFSKEIKAYAQQMTDKEKILKWEILQETEENFRQNILNR